VHGASLPPAAEVVQLYKSYGIDAMRIYEPDVQTLLALNGSNIIVLMGVADGDVPRLAASTSAAAEWVKLNIQRYHPGVLFRYIAVGNEITGAATQNVAPAMKNLNAALSAVGLSDIKVSTVVRMDVLSSSSPPSSGQFKDAYMKDVVAVLNSTHDTGITAPLLVNVYPYFAYTGDTKNIDLNFALFQPSSTVVRDKGINYTNLFDAMVDAVYAALARENVNVPVVISETGWPSAGGVGASVANAQTYNQNLINHVGKGTPKMPYWLETYVFAMFNENLKTGAETEKHFGLFNPDKSPVYPIKF
jgi:exo-beta-1,3-glucanase (GH17 family)